MGRAGEQHCISGLCLGYVPCPVSDGGAVPAVAPHVGPVAGSRDPNISHSSQEGGLPPGGTNCVTYSCWEGAFQGAMLSFLVQVGISSA